MKVKAKARKAEAKAAKEELAKGKAKWADLKRQVDDALAGRGVQTLRDEASVPS